MPWRVILLARAARDLHRLPVKDQAIVRNALHRFVVDPASVDLKKLRGRQSEWRIREGQWCIFRSSAWAAKIRYTH